eukprot:7145109-Lingulodinium_polyedra.AAC.1
MVPGGYGGVSVDTTKQPPSWGPNVESSYSFRRWARDIALRCLSTDIVEAKQAPAIALQLRGAARDMAQDIEVYQLTRGGRLLVNG